MSLWQKPDSDQSSRIPPSPAPPKPAAAPIEPRSSGKPATIGQSVQINGELTGQEDLIIDGKIQGKISVKGHNLTIGSNGRIDAEVHAKSVIINGHVAGNITADDRVEISPTGSVQGDIAAPRVALADGSSFKGSIDMGRKEGSTTSNSGTVNRDVPLTANAVKS
ncbi:MAG: bactofilin family protein [Planctomycetota bacterium]|jgi:cytoskeletal protein CcmA (bactofilin family)